jgi:hypothetical protein
MTVEEHRQAQLSHFVPPGVGFPTWELAVKALGDDNEKRGYRFDLESPDSFPALTKAGEQSGFTSNPYKMPLPDPKRVNQEMLNTMPLVILAREVFENDSGATHALFETQADNDGLNLLVEVVAKLSENATTLDIAQAYGYKERSLLKYKHAYEAMLKKDLIRSKQTSQAELFRVGGTKRLAQGTGAHVQRTTNTAVRGGRGQSDPKKKTMKVVTKNGQKKSWAVNRKPGRTSTLRGSRKVVTKREQKAPAHGANGSKVFTSRRKGGETETRRINPSLTRLAAVFGQRGEGPHIIEMIVGSKKPEAIGNKVPISKLY